MNWLGLMLLAFGLFSMTAATLNWDWFMNHRKAEFFVCLFGRTGARAFYVLMGLGLVTLGIFGLAGMLDLSRSH